MSENCTVFSSCNTCVVGPHCLWCDATRVCEVIDPSDSTTCPGKLFFDTFECDDSSHLAEVETILILVAAFVFLLGVVLLGCYCASKRQKQPTFEQLYALSETAMIEREAAKMAASRRSSSSSHSSDFSFGSLPTGSSIYHSSPGIHDDPELYAITGSTPFVRSAKSQGSRRVISSSPYGADSMSSGFSPPRDNYSNGLGSNYRQSQYTNGRPSQKRVARSDFVLLDEGDDHGSIR